MTHPKAIKASNLFIFFLIAIGISNTPETLIILNLNFFLKNMLQTVQVWL